MSRPALALVLFRRNTTVVLLLPRNRFFDIEWQLCEQNELVVVLALDARGKREASVLRCLCRITQTAGPFGVDGVEGITPDGRLWEAQASLILHPR